MEIVKPMLATASTLPVNSSEYCFEIKWDGLRAVLYIENNQLSVISRNLRNITNQYPELQQMLNHQNSQQLIVDGEIVALTSDGFPSFSLLQHRMNVSSTRSIQKLSQTIPVTYIIFDILQINNTILLSYPYKERRRNLQSLQLSGSYWQTPDYKTGDGHAILQATRSLGLEGIIAKQIHSVYIPGTRSKDWLKIKFQKRQEFVIGGWVPGKGKRSGQIGALLVGYYQNRSQPPPLQQQLIFAGKVGTGFSQDTLNTLKKLMLPITTSSSPFTTNPGNAIFVEPKLIGEVEFTEWTDNQTLRHPSFKGLRFDKDPRYVIRET